MGGRLKVEYSFFEFVFFEERMIGGWRLKMGRLKVGG
jgi:hypothetical protein